MPEKLVEPIVNRLMTIVQSNMAAALTKVGNVYNDGIPLPVPAAANYYFGERLIIPEYPALVFDFEAAQIDPEEYSNLWAIYDWTVSIDILLQTDDPTILARQLARYSRALWEILYGNQDLLLTGPGTPTTGAVSVRPRTGMRSPLVPRGEMLFKGWRWLLEIHRYDDLA
jgi:hypothetical protein